jgi:acyl-CoA thioester hydrolase
MSRIDRQRLMAAELPVLSRIATRFADLDALDHVNNAAAATLLQEARFDFYRDIHASGATVHVRTLLAALYIDYVGEMFVPGVVEVKSGVLSLGRTSVTLAQVARQDGRLTMFAETVMVTADENGPMPHPEPLRAAYERLSARWPELS